MWITFRDAQRNKLRASGAEGSRYALGNFPKLKIVYNMHPTGG